MRRPKAKRTKGRGESRGADDSGALAEAELTALEADISQLQVHGGTTALWQSCVFPCRVMLQPQVLYMLLCTG